MLHADLKEHRGHLSRGQSTGRHKHRGGHVTCVWGHARVEIGEASQEVANGTVYVPPATAHDIHALSDLTYVCVGAKDFDR